MIGEGHPTSNTMKNPLSKLFASSSRRRGWTNFGVIASLGLAIAISPALARGDSLADAAEGAFSGGARTVSCMCESVSNVTMEVVGVFTDPQRLERALAGSSTPFRKER